MALAQLPTGRWQVRWRNPQGARSKQSFDTKLEATAFLEVCGVGRHRGRKRRTRAQVIDVIAASFEVDDAECWVWNGPLTNEGYARLTWKRLGATISGGHRVVFAALGQTLAQEKVVDHLCRNRACVNPDHLELVAQRENIMRSPIAQGALNAAKTHCPQGHPYSADNTYVWRNTKRSTTVRTCKTCQRAYARRRYLAKKETAA